MEYIRRFYNPMASPKDERPKNLGEEIRRVVQSRDFVTTVGDSAPILFGSMAAWPLVWLFKGFAWSDVRSEQPIRLYIRKTFYQAKMMQLFMLTTGILYVISSDHVQSVPRVENVNQDRKKSAEERKATSRTLERVPPYIR